MSDRSTGTTTPKPGEVEGQERATLGPTHTTKRRKLDHDDTTTADSKDADLVSSPPEASSSKVMPLGRALPLFICSIGNPGNHYAHTLHSAGHTLLNSLAERLGYSDFHKEKALGNGSVSYPTSSNEAGGEWTLWQSPSYMNESGKSVRAAYMAWSKNLADGDGKLVIIHDELEKPLGAVSLRTAQGASAKGHNGLKSIMSLMGQTPFARIGIGIGRPASRQSDDVARYVLKKMDPAERATIESAVDQVIAKLKELERS